MTDNVSPSFDAPWTDAFVRLADHCIACVTCAAMDKEGTNLGLLCAEGQRLNEEFRQARRACCPESRGAGHNVHRHPEGQAIRW
ncbi:hypothetical protein GCM10010304_51800 [Streptomyces roseoviolaceus]